MRYEIFLLAGVSKFLSAKSNLFASNFSRFRSLLCPVFLKESISLGEANTAGKHLKTKNMKFDIMFTSDLLRAQETGRLILENMGQSDIPVIKNQCLNERNYGDLAGLNKDDAREKWRN